LSADSKIDEAGKQPQEVDNDECIKTWSKSYRLVCITGPFEFNLMTAVRSCYGDLSWRRYFLIDAINVNLCPGRIGVNVHALVVTVDDGGT
jgi:hypothetical protein